MLKFQNIGCPIHGRNIYFGYVWQSSSKYSVSQKLFFKLATIFPHKTQDNIKIDISKKDPNKKKYGSLVFKPKQILILDNNSKKLMDLNHTTLTLNQ